MMFVNFWLLGEDTGGWKKGDAAPSVRGEGAHKQEGG